MGTSLGDQLTRIFIFVTCCAWEEGGVRINFGQQMTSFLCCIDMRRRRESWYEGRAKNEAGKEHFGRSGSFAGDCCFPQKIPDYMLTSSFIYLLGSHPPSRADMVGKGYKQATSDFAKKESFLAGSNEGKIICMLLQQSTAIKVDGGMSPSLTASILLLHACLADTNPKWKTCM